MCSQFQGFWDFQLNEDSLSDIERARAEGARFELACPLPDPRFSRPGRLTAPAPLHRLDNIIPFLRIIYASRAVFRKTTILKLNRVSVRFQR